MTREKKYPNTDTFFLYNANPKNRITGDCVTRAMCTAMDVPYNELVMDIAKFNCETGYVAYYHEEKFLASKGWVKHNQPRHGDNTKYTGKQFCAMLNKWGKARNFGNVIAMIGSRHIVCIKPVLGKYKIHDTWDSSEGCIGRWWTKE